MGGRLSENLRLRILQRNIKNSSSDCTKVICKEIVIIQNLLENRIIENSQIFDFTLSDEDKE